MRVTDAPSSPSIHSSGNGVNAALTTGSPTCLEETGSIESNTKPLAFPRVLEAQGGWSRFCCKFCHSWQTTYHHAAHLPFVRELAVGTGSLESLWHHWCTMFAHFLHFCTKTMVNAFWKLPHFNRGVRQPRGIFYAWLFIRSQLCLILYTTWAARTFTPVKASGEFLIAFLLDIMSNGSSARYHLAAVPGLALLTPRWHAIKHQKQNWAHRHRRAGLCVPSWRGYGTYIVLYAFLIIPLPVHVLATLHLSAPSTLALEQFWQGTK